MVSLAELSIKNNRFHHGYFLLGDKKDGFAYGKNSAKTILDVLNVESHPDCAILEHDTFGVGESHELARKIFQRPVQGDKKVFIILAGSLTREAANALLKIFEEPPLGTYIFFSLPNQVGIPKTLRSRFVVRYVTKNESKAIMSDDGLEFLRASLSDRLKKIKNTGKDRLANQALFFSLINAFFSCRMYKKVTEPLVILSIKDGLNYINDKGSMPSMFLENLALILPRHVE